MIRVGPAGWSHSDWDGVVYPTARADDFHPLAVIARLFDLVEVTSTHTQVPKPKWASQWCDLLDRLETERFRFSVTLWRGITEDVDPPEAGEVQNLRSLCEVLHQRGRLAAVLARFSQSFKDSVSSRARIKRIAENWGDFPVAFEMSHTSWEGAEAIAWLTEREHALVNLDQAESGEDAEPEPRVTSKSLAYVRLLGRGERSEETDSEGAVDYLYTPHQLAPWAHRIGQISTQAKQTLVVAANGAKAQSVANALEIQAATCPDRTVRIPAPLVEHFPTLREVPGLRLAEAADFDLPPLEKKPDSGQLDLF